jgi:transcriptional regulator with XRE-family HTH domain
MNPPVHNLSQRLHTLRKQWFKSQQAYANHCHELGVPITPTVIADWENSRSEIPARLVPFLAHTLNAQVNDLLPSFTAAEIFALPALLPPPKPDKPVKPASAVRTDFATRQLALDSVLRNFDRKPFLFAHMSSERDRNNPFENLVWNDNRTLLLALLRALNRNHRQVILWYYFGGLTRRQIAAKLNRSVYLVSLRLREGRATLSRLLNSNAGSHWLRREFREQFAPSDREAGTDRQGQAEGNLLGENTL